MSAIQKRDEMAACDGSLLRLGSGREIAIYRRDGVAWIAEFVSRRGEIFTAGEWFALNAGGSALRRAGTDAAAPLSAEVIERIERLHGAEDRVSPAAVAARFLEGLRRFFDTLSRPAPAGALGSRTQRS